MRSSSASLSVAVILTMSLVSVIMAEGIQVSSTPTPAPNMYMGVDANDQQAVRDKQDELNHEKWQQLFGDSSIDDLNFTPDLDSDTMRDMGNKLKSLLQQVINLVNKRPTPAKDNTL